MVQASTLLRLIEAVNDFLEDRPDWIPQGAVVRVDDVYYQALFRPIGEKL